MPAMDATEDIDLIFIKNSDEIWWPAEYQQCNHRTHGNRLREARLFQNGTGGTGTGTGMDCQQQTRFIHDNDYEESPEVLNFFQNFREMNSRYKGNEEWKRAVEDALRASGGYDSDPNLNIGCWSDCDDDDGAESPRSALAVGNLNTSAATSTGTGSATSACSATNTCSATGSTRINTPRTPEITRTGTCRHRPQGAVSVSPADVDVDATTTALLVPQNQNQSLDHQNAAPACLLLREPQCLGSDGILNTSTSGKAVRLLELQLHVTGEDESTSTSTQNTGVKKPGRTSMKKTPSSNVPTSTTRSRSRSLVDNSQFGTLNTVEKRTPGTLPIKKRHCRRITQHGILAHFHEMESRTHNHQNTNTACQSSSRRESQFVDSDSVGLSPWNESTSTCSAHDNTVKKPDIDRKPSGKRPSSSVPSSTPRSRGHKSQLDSFGRLNQNQNRSMHESQSPGDVGVTRALLELASPPKVKRRVTASSFLGASELPPTNESDFVQEQEKNRLMVQQCTPNESHVNQSHHSDEMESKEQSSRNKNRSSVASVNNVVDKAAQDLYNEIHSLEASKCLFKDQALTIFKHSKLKGERKKKKKSSRFEEILGADEVYVLERNPKSQIYFCKDLHSHLHGTIGLPTVSKLEEICKDVRVIKSTENFISDEVAVLNMDLEGGKDSGFLATITSLMKDMMPGFGKAMKRPSKDDKRGTLSCNIGLTTNDAMQYSKVRSF